MFSDDLAAVEGLTGKINEIADRIDEIECLDIDGTGEDTA